MPRAPRPAPLLHRARWAQMSPGLYLSADESWGSGHAKRPRLWDAARKFGQPMSTEVLPSNPCAVDWRFECRMDRASSDYERLVSDTIS